MHNEFSDIYNTLSPELRLLLFCLRQQILSNEQEDVNKFLAGIRDWELFVHLAVRHRVYPMIYRYVNIIQHPAVPSKVVSALQLNTRQNTLKSMQLAGELVKVLQVFEKQGIYAAVLKGFPLGYKLHEDAAIRPFNDLDILIRQEDVAKARTVIEGQGYDRMRPNFTETPGQLRNWLKTECHFNYWHKDKGVCLELHWKLNRYLEISLNEIEDSLTSMVVAGQTVRIPWKEELILYLILHGGGHAWFRLRWLFDIGILFRQGDFSWARLYGLAEHWGIKTLLNQTIILSCSLLLASSVPADIVKRARKDRTAVILADMALIFITDITCEYFEIKKGMRLYSHKEKYRFCIQEGWRRKVAYICRYILMPTLRNKIRISN